MRRGSCSLVQKFGEIRNEIRMPELQRADIHADMALDVIEQAAGLGEHPSTQLDDLAGSLGDRDEVAGADHPPFGVMPAQQCLVARYIA